MPSVYDFRHVELDKVGRGKKQVRVIKAPGGGSSNIFAEPEPGKQLNGNGNGSCSETESVDGSVLSCPSTPVHNGNGINSSAFGYESDTSSTPSSAASSRRGSLAETKNRLFGQPEVTESPRRRVVDRMKSNIFAEPEPALPIVRTPSVKKYEHVVNRNPITGEVYAQAPATNGTTNGGGAVNGQAAIVANGNGTVNGVNGSASMPNTPVRVRQPPGGKSSNIFG